MAFSRQLKMPSRGGRVEGGTAVEETPFYSMLWVVGLVLLLAQCTLGGLRNTSLPL